MNVFHRVLDCFNEARQLYEQRYPIQTIRVCVDHKDILVGNHSSMVSQSFFKKPKSHLISVYPGAFLVRMSSHFHIIRYRSYLTIQTWEKEDCYIETVNCSSKGNGYYSAGEYEDIGSVIEFPISQKQISLSLENRQGDIYCMPLAEGITPSFVTDQNVYVTDPFWAQTEEISNVHLLSAEAMEKRFLLARKNER